MSARKSELEVGTPKTPSHGQAHLASTAPQKVNPAEAGAAAQGKGAMVHPANGSLQQAAAPRGMGTWEEREVLQTFGRIVLLDQIFRKGWGSADDVYEWGMEGSTLSPRILSGVPRRLKDARVIECAGYVRSRRRSAGGRILRRWVAVDELAMLDCLEDELKYYLHLQPEESSQRLLKQISSYFAPHRTRAAQLRASRRGKSIT